MDESTGEKIAVTRVTLQVAREVIGGEEIGFRADVAGSGSVCRTDYGRGLVVDRVLIGRAPEKILLERERKIVDRAESDAGVWTDNVLPSDVVDVAKKRMAVRVELVESADASSALFISARIVKLKVGTRRQVFDGKGIAEDGREHPRADTFGAYRAELPRSFRLKIPISLTDLAPHTQPKSMSLLSSGGAVEVRRLVVSAEIVEIEVQRQEVSGRAAVDTEELVVLARSIDIVLVNDHGLRPKRSERPATDLTDDLSAVEGMWDLGIVARTDQPLGTEQKFLATTAQGYVGFLREWNHDVGEAVKKRVLIVLRGTILSLEVSVGRHQRALALDVQAKIRRDVEIGTQPEPG